MSLIKWDSQGTPYSVAFDDMYFCAVNGYEDALYIFCGGNDLEDRFKKLNPVEKGTFTIVETGFGTGLIFCVAWKLWKEHAPASWTLNFLSIEKFPLPPEELRKALAVWPVIKPQADELAANYKIPAGKVGAFNFNQVRLSIIFDDIIPALDTIVQKGLANPAADALFLDGFSPAKNPEMWTENVFAGLARLSGNGTTLATFTVAGWVRRGLESQGFSTQKVKGYGCKNEMLQGSFHVIPAKAGIQIMKLAFFGIVFLFNISMAFAKPSFDSHTIVNQANDDLNIFKVQSQIADLEKAIDMDPGNVQKYMPLVQFYYSNQIWDHEEETLKDAIASCQNDQGIDLNGLLADALLNQKKWDEAKGYLDLGVKKYSDDPLIYDDLAIYYFNKHDYTAAGKLMKTIALKDKETEDTYYDVYDQIVNQVKENDPGLIQMAKTALDEEPDNFKTHRLYAVVLRNTHYKDFDRQLPEILSHLNIALKLNPKYALTLMSFADTYLMLGKNHQNSEYFKTSLEWLDKIKALNDPNYKRLDYDYANTYSEMNQFDKAIEYAEAYHKQYPDDSDGTDILGIVYNNNAYDDYQKGKDLQKGIALIDKALKLNPEDGMYISTKAELLYKLKKYKEAYKLIQRAHTKLPNEPEINQDVTMIEKAL